MSLIIRPVGQLFNMRRDDAVDLTPLTGKIERMFMSTRHKRAMPASPLDNWWRP